MRNTYKNLVYDECGETRPLGRPRSRREDNIKKGRKAVRVALFKKSGVQQRNWKEENCIK
jgi:hypothetical protein